MLSIGRRRKLLKKQNSFTLVESLLVVVILGVFVGLAAPSFSKSYSNLQANNTARNIAFLMRYAQARAIAERVNYSLNFDSENRSCWLEKESVDSPGVFKKESSRLAKAIVFPGNISIEAERQTIIFFPDGKIDSCRIYLKHANDIKLTISTSGQIGYVEITNSKN
jgi:Tfp pilus assembly protein FimT